jgi:hypothetical protein
MGQMIPHLDEGAIQALIHGELTVDASQHVAECADCRTRIARAREEDVWVRRQLTSLDVTPPKPDVAPVISESRRRVSSGGWRRAAAIVLLAGGAGIVWAVPAVRGFVGRIAGSSPSDQAAPLDVSGVVVDSTRFSVTSGGIAVRPGARFLISFEASQSRGEIRIRLVDGPELSVMTLGATVPLESRQDELIVGNRGKVADYEVAIPSSAAEVEVRIAGARRFLKQAARIIAGDSGSAPGRYVIPLRP